MVQVINTLSELNSLQVDSLMTPISYQNSEYPNALCLLAERILDHVRSKAQLEKRLLIEYLDIFHNAITKILSQFNEQGLSKAIFAEFEDWRKRKTTPMLLLIDSFQCFAYMKFNLYPEFFGVLGNLISKIISNLDSAVLLDHIGQERKKTSMGFPQLMWTLNAANNDFMIKTCIGIFNAFIKKFGEDIAIKAFSEKRDDVQARFENSFDRLLIILEHVNVCQNLANFLFQLLEKAPSLVDENANNRLCKIKAKLKEPLVNYLNQNKDNPRLESICAPNTPFGRLIDTPNSFLSFGLTDERTLVIGFIQRQKYAAFMDSRKQNMNSGSNGISCSEPSNKELIERLLGDSFFNQQEGHRIGKATAQAAASTSTYVREIITQPKQKIGLGNNRNALFFERDSIELHDRVSATELDHAIRVPQHALPQIVGYTEKKEGPVLEFA